MVLYLLVLWFTYASLMVFRPASFAVTRPYLSSELYNFIITYFILYDKMIIKYMYMDVNT